MFRIEGGRIRPEFLALILKSDDFVDICKRASRGTTNRKRLKEELFLAATIPVPSVDEQLQLIQVADAAKAVEISARDVGRSVGEVERALHDVIWKEKL